MRRRGWRRFRSRLFRVLGLQPPPRPPRLPGFAVEDGWKLVARERRRVHLN